ncbi:hypothetical protein AbraIFM66951_010969 [Aspergillus brasiliensis]|nr:hypothetical protein AbraIFM66951_010969 [Aspergillus brasiliensis]
MLSYLWRCYSTALTALRYFGYLGYRAFGLLSHIFPLSIGYHPSRADKPDDLVANHPAGDDASTPNCDTYTVQLHPQRDLEVIKSGSSARVYKVDDHIVLKSSSPFQPPGHNTSASDRWHYTSNTTSQPNKLQNERTLLQLLQNHPHPHIIEAIDVNQPEGIYLRRYHSLSEDKIPPQRHRIRWYRDLTDALCHIHKLGIVHANVQIDNILLDDHDRVILSDFSAASPFHEPNLAFSINGPSPTLSEATDIFAMGSLIYHMEHGIEPKLSVDSQGTWVLPHVHTGRPMLDTIIREAWLGHYGRASEMLECLVSIDTVGDVSVPGSRDRSISTEELRRRVREWREYRENTLVVS